MTYREIGKTGSEAVARACIKLWAGRTLMTCREFSLGIDRLLAGDAASSLSTLRHHAAQCRSCRDGWAGVQTLLEAFEAGPSEPDAVQAEPVRQRLRAAIDEVGHPVVRFDSVETPIGPVFVALSNAGVCDVTFGQTSEDVYRRCLLERAPEVWRDEVALEEVTKQLAAYFTGRLDVFSVPVDLRTATPFTARVLAETRKVQFGHVTSYGELATRLGVPGGSRAVGGALGRNPVPIIVPCHRVLARGGRLGGFTGGLAVKRALLGLERHRLDEETQSLF